MASTARAAPRNGGPFNYPYHRTGIYGSATDSRWFTARFHSAYVGQPDHQPKRRTVKTPTQRYEVILTGPSLRRFFNKTVPENEPYYQHDYEADLIYSLFIDFPYFIL